VETPSVASPQQTLASRTEVTRIHPGGSQRQLSHCSFSCEGALTATSTSSRSATPLLPIFAADLVGKQTNESITLSPVTVRSKPIKRDRISHHEHPGWEMPDPQSNPFADTEPHRVEYDLMRLKVCFGHLVALRGS
jgi:hypothetical protein